MKSLAKFLTAFVLTTLLTTSVSAVEPLSPYFLIRQLQVSQVGLSSQIVSAGRDVVVLDFALSPASLLSEETVYLKKLSFEIVSTGFSTDALSRAGAWELMGDNGCSYEFENVDYTSNVLTLTFNGAEYENSENNTTHECYAFGYEAIALNGAESLRLTFDTGMNLAVKSNLTILTVKTVDLEENVNSQTEWSTDDYSWLRDYGNSFTSNDLNGQATLRTLFR